MRDQGEAQKVATRSGHDQGDRVVRLGDGGRLGQRQRLCDERIGHVAREEGEDRDRQGAGTGCDARQPGSRAHRDARRDAEDQLCGVDPLAEENGRPADRTEQGGSELASRVDVVCQSQRGHRSRAGGCVPGRSPVCDDRAPARKRFQARDPARRVHEHIGRDEELAHPLGETEHADAQLVRECPPQARPARIVAACEAHDERADLERRLNRSLQVADAPAASGDHDDRSLRGQAEGPPRISRRSWRPELRGDER